MTAQACGGGQRPWPRLGALLFDLPDDPVRGWACLGEGPQAAGGAFRFDEPGVAGLPDDTVWITNYPAATLAGTGLAAAGRFHDERYLRESMGRLCEECGCTDPRRACEFSAALFARSLRLAAALVRCRDFLPRWSLRRGLRVAAGPVEDMLVEPRLKDVLEEARLTNVSCPLRAPGEGETTLRLRVPAMDHCRAVLATPLPAGPFEAVRRIPGPLCEPAIRRRWFSGITEGGRLPGLFRLAWRGVDGERARLLVPGLPGRGSDRAPGAGRPRRWYPTALVARLMEAGDVVVHEALVCRRVRILSVPAALAASLPGQAALSTSASVVLDNLWSGMCLPRDPRAPKKDGLLPCNADAPFLRAADLVLLHDRALALQRLGLRVTGYAAGSIRIRAASGEGGAVWAACTALGLLPPALGAEARAFLPDPYQGMRTGREFLGLVEREPRRGLATLQALRAAGRWKEILALDAVLVRRLLRGPGGREG